MIKYCFAASILFISFSCEKDAPLLTIHKKSEIQSIKNSHYLEFQGFQPTVYKRVEIPGEKIPKKLSMNGDITRYKIENYIFFFGLGQSWGNTMVVEDLNGSEVCIYSDSISDSQIFNPTFFKTNDKNDPLIIMIESGSFTESKGNTVLIEHHSEFRKIGNIDVATRYNRDNIEMPDNIAPHTEIRINKNNISFGFTIEDLSYFPKDGDMSIEQLKGGALTYLYENGNFNLYQNY